MRKFEFNLQLFAEGAEAGDGTGDNAVDAGQQTVENVQDDAEFTTDEAEERKAKFQELIDGEYKDMYRENVQSIVKDRLSKHVQQNNELSKKLNRQTPIIDELCRKYNCDVEGLQEAINSDDEFFRNAATDRGMTVEQYKEFSKLEQENAALRAAAEEIERQKQGEQIWQQWLEQAEQMKNWYPDFDLRAEVEAEPEFARLLQSGIDIKTAYEAIHIDDIMTGVLGRAVSQTAKAVANNIDARNRRPSENGTNSQAVHTKQYDVDKMTKQQRDELIKRAARGEKITL
ncbi:MAG: hypothetical protein J6I65_07585 [Lachnospiraceae bacterium]|nr:hypothetical protein [Lachnospiraceae bacterium]